MLLAIFQEGHKTLDFYKEQFDRARASAAAAAGGEAVKLLVFTNGAFTLDAAPTNESIDVRRERFLAAGADLVFELPQELTLLSWDSYIFGVAQVLSRMNVIDKVVLPYDFAREEIWKEIQRVLFYLPREYQMGIKTAKEKKLRVEDEIPNILENFKSGARDFMNNRQLRFGVELFNTLRLNYSSVKPLFVDLMDENDTEPQSPSAESSAAGRSLAAKLREAVLVRYETHDERLKMLQEIFGGFIRKAERVLAVLESDDAANDFVALSEQMALGKYAPVDMRQYMMHIIEGYRSIDHLMDSLHSYCSQITLAGCRDESQETLALLREKSWVEIIE